MVLDSVLVVEGIKAIPGAIKVFKEAWSTFRKKAPKPEDIIPIEENLQEIFRRLDSIKEGAWIINAYFELYGRSLDLYTTSDDFIKAMAKSPPETKSLFASTIHLDLKKKFDRGIAQFLSAYGEEVDQNDVGVIELHINKLRDLISEGKGYVASENYKELEKVNINITVTSNELLGMSQARLLKIIKELQKIRGA
jgi:hypothetical protein